VLPVVPSTYYHHLVCLADPSKASTRHQRDAELRPEIKRVGERISARDPDRQTAEIQIRVALMNRFSALGTAEIVRVV
jgi:hypothetical protein